MTARAWPTGVVLTAASGVGLAPFDQTFELVTELAGWPVMTHQLARHEVWDGVRAKIVAQAPWVAHAIENMPNFDSTDPQLVREQVDRFVGRIIALQGRTVVLDSGDPLPVLPLVAGLENLGEVDQ